MQYQHSPPSFFQAKIESTGFSTTPTTYWSKVRKTHRDKFRKYAFYDDHFLNLADQPPFQAWLNWVKPMIQLKLLRDVKRRAQKVCTINLQIHHWINPSYITFLNTESTPRVVPPSRSHASYTIQAGNMGAAEYEVSLMTLL